MQKSTFGDYDEDEDLDPADIEERKEVRENDKLAEIVLDCQIPFPYELFDTVDPDGESLALFSPIRSAKVMVQLWKLSKACSDTALLIELPWQKHSRRLGSPSRSSN